MNEKAEKQVEGIRNGRFGVEIEMYDITRETAAKTAAGFFGTGRYENTAYRNGYMSWSAWDAEGRESGSLLSQVGRRRTSTLP